MMTSTEAVERAFEPENGVSALVQARLELAMLGQRDIPAYVKRVFGVLFDPWQADVADSVSAALNGTGKRYVSVRSGHGPGKSMTAALIVLAVLLCYSRVKIVCTAPTAAQLFDALFAEIMLWFRTLPKAVQDEYDLKTDRIALKIAGEECFLSVRTSSRERPEALQGIHAEVVLLVVDEASGVDEAVFKSSGGSMSGQRCCMLLLGNPTRATGYFWASHNKPGVLERFVKFRVNGEDSPRVARDFIEQIAALYGVDSDEYRVRVKGDFPRGDINTLIGRDLIEFARKRVFVPVDGDPCVWGIDPARFGDDDTGFVERTGRSVTLCDAWHGLDTMVVVGRVKALWDTRTDRHKPKLILVDPIGIGAGVIDRLKELGLPARALNVTEVPSHHGAKGFRLRDDNAWKMREWFTERSCTLAALAPDKYDSLAAQLAEPRYEFMSDGTVRLESKVEMKKRQVKSPDLFDALSMTFAQIALAALSGALRESLGGYGTGTGDRPTKRNVNAVV